MDKIKILESIIRNSKHIVFFTGAGISVPSNIPDFRSADGLYNQESGFNYSPEDIISHSFFLSHPKEFFTFYKTKMVYPTSKPNAAHLFIAKLQENKRVSVVTQNIDGLHYQAGSKEVYELHGSVYRNRCMKCGRFYTLDDVLNQEGIPYCPSCSGIIKPEVVLYEEQLDEDVIEGAIKAIHECDTLIVIGTSLKVYPAASFIRYFKGRYIVTINKEDLSQVTQADLSFNDDVINVVSKINI